MILCVVTAAATMQAAGGLDYLVVVADKALRIWPAGITIVAPIVTYVFTLAAGTGHIVYALLPVIAEVSRSAGVRPERPLSISTIASQQAITASPISAATVALLGLLAPAGIGLHQILLICIPSTFIGSLLGAVSVMWMGPELKDDPEYQERLAKGLIAQPRPPRYCKGKPDARTWRSHRVFGCCVVGRGTWIVSFVATRLYGDHEWPRERAALDMAPAIMIVMLAAAGVIMLAFKASPTAAVKGTIMNAGVVALISIAGLGWLGSSFFEGNRSLIIASISGVVQAACVGVCLWTVCTLHLAIQPGSDRRHAHAGRGSAGIGGASHDRDVPCGEWILLSADLRDLAGGNLVRPDWHHEDR